MNYLNFTQHLGLTVLFIFFSSSTLLHAAIKASPFALPQKTNAPVSSQSNMTSPFSIPPEPNGTLSTESNHQLAAELLKTGTNLAIEGKFEEAVLMLERSLEQDPNNLMALNNLGLVFRKLGQLNKALKAYQFAIFVNPDFGLTYKNMGILFEKQGNLKLATQSYKQYCILAPDALDNKKVSTRADWLLTQIKTPPTEENKRITDGSNEQIMLNKYFEENSLNWQNIGANLFAEYVVQKDREKLFMAIKYLEQASVGLPDHKAIRVDLADAYMETELPELTAWAIELYESVFESFSEDPLVARLANAYFQSGHFKVAFALAEKRLEFCPHDLRSAAAIQLAYIASASEKETVAITIITKEIQRRGDDPLLQLTIATLMESQGETNAALAITFSLLSDKNLDSNLRTYVKKVKDRLLGGTG